MITETDNKPEEVKKDDGVDLTTEEFVVTLNRKNAAVTFSKNNDFLIAIVPIAYVPRPFAKGFLLEVIDIVNAWHAERIKIREQLKLSGQKFNFVNGVRNLLRK